MSRLNTVCTVGRVFHTTISSNTTKTYVIITLINQISQSMKAYITNYILTKCEVRFFLLFLLLLPPLSSSTVAAADEEGPTKHPTCTKLRYL